MRLVQNLWRLLRPGHWVKNGFVFLGILFANAWRQPGVLEKVLLVAICFSLVSSGVYAFNDLLDREQDRSHPKKKSRPLAAGHLSGTIAIVAFGLLCSVGIAVGYLVSFRVTIVLFAYVVINVAYSAALKNVVLLDVFIIAGGFMLRILAGTICVGIPPSQWLLLCGLMVALFLGFSKRRAELYTIAGNGSSQRRVLDHYRPVLLDKMIVITATGVILTYSLYTMSPVTVQIHHTEALIYTVPFVMYGIFRYIFLLHHQATGADPALEIFRDPHVLLSILGWLFVTIWLIAR
jgi:4-hydroxybenzoate polyprenyltransferase